MKYGETLRQRSIPEWGHYNIDYDYLKDLIKRNTTTGNGQALSIPGQGATTEKAFGDTFFSVLKTQHDRINLFVKSKSGEIERRLEYIGKQLAQLQARHYSSVENTRLPARVVERYAKIDADVSRAGEEIRCLSRFRVAQKTGFHKILKKYKRWTKDRELERRFKQEVTSDQGSFFQLDHGYLLDQYIYVLGAVRAPFGFSSTSTGEVESDQRSAASRLARAVNGGPEIDLDVALTAVPLGPYGSRPTYWVHPDHVIELELLLLQYMRLHSPQATTDMDSRATTPTTRRTSSADDTYFGTHQDVGLAVLDHPEVFAQKENASTVGASEEKSGAVATVASGCVRWTTTDEVAVMTGLDTALRRQDGGHIAVAKIKKNKVDALWDQSRPDENDETEDSQNVRQVQTWLADHKEVKTIAGACSRRLRFVGLHNNAGGGIWATLDTDILMKDTMHTHCSSDDWVAKARADAFPFPHAVLSIRREGLQSSALIQTLERSHLVERVRGFSIEAHAVWTCCKPTSMSSPIWLPLLDQDIRKLPEVSKRRRRKGSSTIDLNNTPPRSSASATSVASYVARNGETSATSVSEFVDPPPLQAFRKKRKSKPHDEIPEPDTTQRYWNEYDDPESGDEGYYIYVDPNASVKFPGQETLESLIHGVRQCLGLQAITEEPVSPTEASTPDVADSEDESTVNGNGYGTIAMAPSAKPREGFFSSMFQALRDAQPEPRSWRASELERQSLLTEVQIRLHEREMAKLQLYMSSLGAAAVLDGILVILTTTSRRKLRGEVDSAIILGVICNLLLLLVAVTSMRTRQERLGLLHQGGVFLFVIVMLVVDGLLFRWALNQ